MVVKTVVATATTTLLLAGIFFYFCHRFAMARKRQRNKFDTSFRREAVVTTGEIRQRSGTLRGIIVDDNGLDVVYLRRVEGGQLTSCFSRGWFNPMEEEEEKRMDTRGYKQKKSEPIQERPLFHGSPHLAEEAGPVSLTPSPPCMVSESLPRRLPPPPLGSIKHTPVPPPPPPLPPLPTKRTPAPPPPPPPLAKRSPAPPPPPKASGSVSSLKPPPAPRGKTSSSSKSGAPIGESPKEIADVKLKLKPLHWDKVIANADHSMVWDEINDGSFRFDDELMEALFGYTTANRKAPESNNISSSAGSSFAASKIFILEPRKSQNTAIVLRSLGISCKRILDALLEGHGLNADTLEKLVKISPTQEEASKILQFSGNPTKLADAESFLYHILKAIPSAFIRFNAMLFRLNYDPEILHLKESLQTLELGCKELRTRGIFLKLLEAILKAGNRMNAGTARGNAQGFNLSALRKLSSVKSTNGKTTLLHFVVEQVVRSEGKRSMINQNHSLGISNGQGGNKSEPNSDSQTAKEEMDKEWLMLGLPALEGLSIQLSNVKKAATIDHDSFINMCSTLKARVAEIRQLVTRCADGERGGFVEEMKGFLEECDEELKVVSEEQTRVMELVKKTTEYYQAGASKDKGTPPLQLFGVVKDFLDMVDQVCLDITRKLQKKNVPSVGPSPPLSPSSRTSEKFQNLQSYFMSDKHGTTSFSDSEDDF